MLNNITFTKQLVRLGYDIQSRRENPVFNLILLHGTCVLSDRGTVLLGDLVTGISTDAENRDVFLFTNNEKTKEDLGDGSLLKIKEYIISQKESELSHINFFTSLLDLLDYKAVHTGKESEQGSKSDRFKAATLNFSGENHLLSVSIGNVFTAIVTDTATGDKMSLTSLAEVKGVLKYMHTLTSLHMVSKTAKGSYNVAIEGILPAVFKELFSYFNRTIVAEYLQENGSVRKLYIFDKQVIELVPVSKTTRTITTFSINKLPDVYPDNIYLETITARDLIARMESDVASSGFTLARARR